MDMGITWTEPEILFDDPGIFTRNQLLNSVDGEVLMPMYYTPQGYAHYASHYSVVKRSRDGGKTFTEENPMTVAGEFLL